MLGLRQIHSHINLDYSCKVKYKTHEVNALIRTEGGHQHHHSLSVHEQPGKSRYVQSKGQLATDQEGISAECDHAGM